MTNALVVIDVQESFRRRPVWAACSNPDVVVDVQRLVDAARARGAFVVWVLHAEPGSNTPFDPVNGFVRLMAGLEPAADEPVITKTSRNCFSTTNLGQLLQSRGVTAVTICGIQTEQCCETTARLASDMGYQVTFVTDAMATFPIAHRDAPADRPLAELLADPRTLSTDAVVERTEYALAHRFATIAGVGQLVG